MIIKEIPQSGETRYFEIQTTKIIKDINDKDVEVKDTNKKVCLQELSDKKQELLKQFQDVKVEHLAIEEFEINNVKLPMPEPVEPVEEVVLIEEDIIKEEDLTK